jgi:hypothetical protein
MLEAKLSKAWRLAVKDKDRDSPSDKIKEESPLANNPPAAA